MSSDARRVFDRCKHVGVERRGPKHSEGKPCILEDGWRGFVAEDYSLKHTCNLSATSRFPETRSHCVLPKFHRSTRASAASSSCTTFSKLAESTGSALKPTLSYQIVVDIWLNDHCLAESIPGAVDGLARVDKRHQEAIDAVHAALNPGEADLCLFDVCKSDSYQLTPGRPHTDCPFRLLRSEKTRDFLRQLLKETFQRRTKWHKVQLSATVLHKVLHFTHVPLVFRLEEEKVLHL